jgi:ketosteroid isomerase-like protein
MVDARRRIEAYFDACNRGDADGIASHFTPDAVVYDSNHAPVRGADTIGVLWTKIRAKWGNTRWHVDSCIAEDNHAAIEWTVTGTHPTRGAFCVRGSEHYTLAGGKIAEIRQYWTFDPEAPGAALHAFPYAERKNFLHWE